VAATFAEIKRLQENGPDAAELEKVKSGWIQNHRRSLRENGYWVANLQSSLTEGTDPASILKVEQQVAALTAQDVQAAARRYFDTKNYVQVVLNPELANKAANVARALATGRQDVPATPGT